MANLTTNTIEGLTLNNNLKLTAEVVEVDDRVKLNAKHPDDGTQIGVTIEAPGNNASYTLIMPDNSVAVDKFLRVKSIVGDQIQLEFADGPETKKILNATQLTSGYLPDVTYPSSGIPGAALELIERRNISQSTEITDTITISNLLDDTVYRMVGDFIFIDNDGNLTNSYPKIEWLDASGNKQDDIAYTRWYGFRDNPNSKVRDHIDASVGNSAKYYSFNCDFYTKAGLNWMMWWAMAPRRNNAKKAEIYATFETTDDTNFDTITKRIHGMKFTSFHNHDFGIGTDLRLYKYREA